MARFTEEQITRANNISIEQLLRSKDEPLKREGREFRWMRDKSVTINGSKWFDHAAQTGGGAVSFVKRFYNMDFRQAMEYLLNGEQGKEFVQAKPKEIKKQPFHLPEPNSDMRRVFAYLVKTRGIDADVVEHFAKAHTLYQSKDHHNAVFVGMDENGKPQHAHQKSTNTYGKGFRNTVAGSDGRYGFMHKGTSDTIYCFEAPIDMLSFITLNKENWKQHSYIAVSGTSDIPLFHFLKNNPHIENVCLCLDNDKTGHMRCEKISEQLKEQGYYPHPCFSELKDWNYDLLAARDKRCQTYNFG